MKDPIELLRTIYPALQNGHKEALTQAVDLVKALQAHNAELEQAARSALLPEAPACVNFKMVHVITQTEAQFTLRDHDEASLQERLNRYISSLVDSGWLAFDAYVDQRRAEREANGKAPAATPLPTPASLPQAAPPPAAVAGGEPSFPAKTLNGSVVDGKTYWKIKGGKFTQHGVAIWPEALQEAGFDPGQLSPMTVYNLDGYTAFYTVNDKGNPHKVVRLSK